MRAAAPRATRARALSIVVVCSLEASPREESRDYLSASWRVLCATDDDDDVGSAGGRRRQRQPDGNVDRYTERN